MRKIAALCLLLASLPLLGCVGLSTQGRSTSALGPDSPTTAETTAAQTPSTLPERMRAAATDLWAWYNGLKSKVDPAIEPMKKLYVAAQEVVVSVQAKDWLRALGYATTAWELVDNVKGMVR